MADEEIVTEEQPRELTTEEAFSPVRNVMGEQATGVVELGEGAFKPEQQSVQPNEFLSTDNTLLDSAARDVAATQVSATPSVDIPEAPTGLGNIDAIDRNLTTMPTDVQGAQITERANSVVDTSQVVDERTKQQMLERGSLADAKTQELALQATTKYQVESLYESLEEGKPLPGWAAKNVRKVQDIMNARGLGASSVAAAAMVQAIAESALPIAIQDANKFAAIQLQNLNNQQQTALTNAATLAAMDKQNLDNRMKAAQQNAQTFLAIDTKNADLEQQADLISYEARKQALFTDTAAENARININAKSESEINRFYDQLAVSASAANANRQAAMDQFNVDQSNSVKKYNAKLADSRDQFNATMSSAIEQSNALWRRSLNTANTAEQNNANRINASAVLGIQASALDALWQEYRDDVSFAFTSTENTIQRNQQLALTAIANQFATEMFEAQVDADSQKAVGSFIGSLLEKSFVGVAKGLLNMDSDTDNTGYNPTTVEDFT